MRDSWPANNSTWTQWTSHRSRALIRRFLWRSRNAAADLPGVMFRQIAFVTPPAFGGDRLFAEGSRDGSLEPFRLLRRRLAERGQVLRSADLYERGREIPDLIVCMDTPSRPLDDLLPRE